MYIPRDNSHSSKRVLTGTMFQRAQCGEVGFATVTVNKTLTTQ